MSDVGQIGVGILNIIGGLLIFLLTIPTGIVSIASFVVGSNYRSVSCDDSSFMSLPLWIIINAGVSVLYCICGILLFLTYRRNHQEQFLIYLLTSTLALMVFKLPWNIVGSTILFKYSRDCYSEANSLWSLTLSVLIIQWIIMSLITILGIFKFNKNKGNFEQVA